MKLLGTIVLALIVSLVVFFGTCGYIAYALLTLGSVELVLLESLFFLVTLILILYYCYLSMKDILTDRMFKL